MLSPSNHRSRTRTAAMAAVVPAEAPAANIKRKWSAHAIVAAVIAVALLALPSAAAAHEGFSDVSDDSTHGANIHTLDHAGTFDGTFCGRWMFCPGAPLSRAHMAVWLVRVVDGSDPASVTATRFVDVNGAHPQAAFIERFAQLGITVGCTTTPLSYCPDENVTRAQMASFLVRAFDLESGGESAGFADVAAAGTHSDNIDTLAATEITVGCDTDPLSYCPGDDVTRAQMASFLVRADAYASQEAAAGSYTAPTVVLDNGWVVYGTDHEPTVHPDTPETSWDRGEWQFGERLNDWPRPSEPVQEWADWCTAHSTPVRCGSLLESMIWAVDYLGAEPQCVTAQYRRRIEAAVGATDGVNNYKLVHRVGWHRCPTVIDPIQPDGRLLSAHTTSVADRCRVVLPPDAELEFRIPNGQMREGLTCDTWAERVDRKAGTSAYTAHFYSARLAEEWLEHFIGMPVRYGSLHF